MRSKYIISLILTLFVVSTIKAQDTTSFDYWEKKILSNESFSKMKINLIENEFEILNDKKFIPKPLTKLLGENKWKVKFSNSNEDYRSTDIVVDKNQPSRQIMLLARNGSFVLLTYKHGGIGHHHHILWCEIEKNEVTDLWIGVTFKDLYTKEEVLNAINIDPVKLNTNMVCK